MSWTDRTLAQLLPRPARPGGRPSARIVGAATWPYAVVVVGVGFLVASLAVLTWFAALTAGVEAVRRLVLLGDARVARVFWSALRTDLWRRVVIGAVLLPVLALVLLNAAFLQARPDPVAIPLLLLNVVWAAMWVVVAAAAARHCAQHRTGSPGGVLRAAATEAFRPQVGHLVVLASVATSLVIAVTAPLLGLFFSAGLVVLGVAGADLLTTRTAPGGDRDRTR